MGQVAYLDAVATTDTDGKVALFILNRDISKAHTVEVNWQDRAPSNVQNCNVMTGDDLKALNTFDAPNRVVPHGLAKPTTASGKTKFEVPARSYTVIQWGA